MAKVSIIMSVYNQEDYLLESINSILRQTFTEFMFIIINDGSTDRSKEIIKSFDDPRLFYYENVTNKGLIYSLNRALEISKDATYIARMDSDDISFHSRISEQVAYLDNNPTVGLLGTAVEYFGDNVKPFVKHPPQRHLQLTATLFCQNPFYHPTIMIRNSVLKNANLEYSKEYPRYDDYNLWVELVGRCEFANLSQILLSYRRHDKNEGSINDNLLDLDYNTFISIIRKLSRKLKMHLEESDLEVLGVITSKTRSHINKLIPLNVIKSVGESLYNNSNDVSVDKDYLAFKYFERALLYLIVTSRFSDIIKYIFYKSNLIYFLKLLKTQISRKD